MTGRFSLRLIQAERLTLAVLLSGVASLALSDFVSSFYWGLVVAMAAVRVWLGPRFSLTEMQASLIGWAGLLWVGLELTMGRALVVAFTDFLLILSLAIVVEAATPRNHLHRMLVGFFLILGAAVLTDSVLYIFPLSAFVIFVWRASHCLYGMQLPGGDLKMSSWRADGAAMLAVGAMAGVLFVMLPRYDFHTYLKPVQPRMETSGFSDQVNLGDFARSLDATVVMRVEPLGRDKERFRKLMQGRYWRGVTLAEFNGRGWERTIDSSGNFWRKGRDITFREQELGEPFAVYRDASDHAFIVVPEALGKFYDIPDGIYGDRQGVLRFEEAPDRRLRIVMQLGSGEYLQLLREPKEEEKDSSMAPSALQEWADRIVGAPATPEETMRELVTELQGWEYDLNATIDNDQPVSSFLELKRGHCELYATALALAARWRGIPARVVNGFYGGEWNDVGGFYLIRQQHAHSWVEAWIDGRWQRFDATPASRWRLTGVRFPAIDEVWESIKLSWYRYVLEFQNSDRTESVKSLLVLIKKYLKWIAAALVLIAVTVLLIRSNLSLPSLPFRRGLISRLDRWLRHRGIEREKHQPVRHLPLPRGISQEQWSRFVTEWEKQAYGNAGRWSIGQLKRHLRAL